MRASLGELIIAHIHQTVAVTMMFILQRPCARYRGIGFTGQSCRLERELGFVAESPARENAANVGLLRGHLANRLHRLLP